MTDRLSAGQALPKGGEIRSRNGRTRIVFQGDGNFVLYGDRRALWDVGSVGRGARVVMQADGNLVVYDRAGRAIWDAGTAGHPGAYLLAQDDGNGVVYQAGRALWSTTTAGFRRYERSGGLIGTLTDAVSVVVTPYKKIAEAVTPILAVVAPLASVIPPPVGTAIGAGVAATIAVGRGQSVADIALSAARGAIPGGAIVRAAFDFGVGLAKGGSLTSAALGAAKGALPDSPIAHAAFDAAVKIAAGGNVTDAALSLARSQIPKGPLQHLALAGFDAGVHVAARHPSPHPELAIAKARAQITSPVHRAAFDAGVMTAKKAPPHELARHASALAAAHPAAAAVFAKASLSGAVARRTLPVVHERLARVARAGTRRRLLSPRASTWVTVAVRTRGVRRRETAGLDPDGHTYTVDPGDSAWRIAQNLTGDGNHHYVDLLIANHPPKTLIGSGGSTSSGGAIGPRSSWNFKYLKPGEKLKIPAGWKLQVPTAKAPGLADAVVLAPVSAVTPIAPPTVAVAAAPVAAPSAPALAGPAPAPLTPLTAHVAPVVLATPGGATSPVGAGPDDPAAVAQAKALLVAWEHTDGLVSAGLPDYGGNPDDKSPIWGPRDTLELRAFCVWANAQGSALPLSGDLTQEKLDALVLWAERKANPAAPSSAPTGVSPAPTGGTLTSAGMLGEIPVIGVPETSISPVTGTKQKDSGYNVLLALGLGVVAVYAMSDKKSRRGAVRGGAKAA